MMESKQPPDDQACDDVRLAALPGLLSEEARRLRRIYAIIDMGRIHGDLRQSIVNKLESFECEYISLLDEPYQRFQAFGPLLVYTTANDPTLLNVFGACNGDVVSAWVISSVFADPLALHLKQVIHAVDADNAQYLLRYYDPVIIPILRRLADKEWWRKFFSPFTAWWYPVATPTQETWRRIAGDKNPMPLRKKMPLPLTDELWAALETDPLPYQVLNAVEQEFPARFTSDCYGVRVAQVERLLDAGKACGLKTHDDLFSYARALLEDPARAGKPDWQAALRRAAASEAPLSAYFTPT